MKKIESYFVLPASGLVEDIRYTVQTTVRTFIADCKGLAASEVALMLPLMLTLLLGIVDLGNALIINKKTSTASQVVADLLTRQPVANDADVDDAYAAGRMTLQPYPTGAFGVDIASIRFEGDDADPVVQWRETFNMDPNDQVEEMAVGLGTEGEGVLVVTTQYNFEPLFTHTVVGDRLMQEIAVTRPRRGSYITRGN
jgi:Flp pilus assembly protein TadG